MTDRPRERPITVAPGLLHRIAAGLPSRWEQLRAHLARWERRLPWLVELVRAVYLPLSLVLVGFIGYEAFTKVTLSNIRLWPILVAYATALLWWLALAAGWSTLVTERIKPAPMAAWCKTQVARYLPGGIWAPVARATTVQGRIRDKTAAVAAENIVVLATSVGVAGVWLTVHDPRWAGLVVVALLPIPAGRWLERRTRVTSTGVVRTTGLYIVGFVAYGLSGLLSQVAVSGVRSPTYPLYVAGAACLAWAVGLVVVFAPGGVGVRELTYIALLSHLYPRAELQAAAVTARLVTVLAELTVLATVSSPLWRRAESVQP